jgi:predicted DNA-binding transcriptional regulator YafY
MNQRTQNLETVQLALEILRRIPRGRKITANEIHKQLKEIGFDRDIRTIQRQLEMLSDHFDIERDDRSKPYGYRWLEFSRGLSIPDLSPQESLLLRLAEEHLRNILPARLMKSLAGLFQQAKQNLTVGVNSKLEKQWPHKVRVVSTTQPLLPPKIAVGIFDVVSEALYGNYWLTLDYQNRGGYRSEIEVMPLGLAQQGPRLYLVCRYKGFDNERSLAMHRIRSARISLLRFEYPKDFNLAHYDDDGRFGFGEGQKIQLSFTITQDAGIEVLECPLSKDQLVEELDDKSFRITATVIDSGMLDRWLLSFGEEVTDICRIELGD